MNEFSSDSLTEAFALLENVEIDGGEVILDSSGEYLSLEGYPTSKVLQMLPRIQTMTPEIKMIIERGW